MARSYGRFTTSIWRDPDFTSLTLEQQAVYFTLGLQPEVSAAGTLALTERRWAALSQDTTRTDVERIIRSLVEHAGRHLVIDEGTEELLIRKFIKWDGGWSNSLKRLPVVIEAVSCIASVHIRDTAVEELRKLCVGDMGTDEQRAALRHRLSTFDRVVDTEGDNSPFPQPANLEGDPLDADASEPPSSMFCPAHPNGTTEPCGPCGTARRIFDAWHEADARRQQDRVDAERRARRDCSNCNDQGLVEDHAGQITGRCDHAPLEVAV